MVSAQIVKPVQMEDKNQSDHQKGIHAQRRLTMLVGARMF